MKIVAKISGVLIAVGLVLLIIGSAMGLRSGQFPWADFWNHSGENTEHAELSGNNLSFHAIDLDVDLADVTILSGDDFRVELDWHGSNYRLSAREDDGVLTVRSEDSAFGSNNVGATVTISLPLGTELDALSLQLDLGDITVLDQYISGKAFVQTDLGSVLFSNVTATNEMDVSSNMGDLSLDGDLCCNLDAHSDLGGVVVTTRQSADQYSCTAETDLGEVSADGRDWGTSYRSHGGTYDWNVSTDLGNVELFFEAG